MKSKKNNFFLLTRLSLNDKKYDYLMILLVDWSAVFRPLGVEKFRVHRNMCQNVGLLRMFPGITTQTVCSLLQELQNQGKKQCFMYNHQRMLLEADYCKVLLILLQIF